MISSQHGSFHNLPPQTLIHVQPVFSYLWISIQTLNLSFTTDIILEIKSLYSVSRILRNSAYQAPLLVTNAQISNNHEVKRSGPAMSRDQSHSDLDSKWIPKFNLSSKKLNLRPLRLFWAWAIGLRWIFAGFGVARLLLPGSGASLNSLEWCNYPWELTVDKEPGKKTRRLSRQGTVLLCFLALWLLHRDSRTQSVNQLLKSKLLKPTIRPTQLDMIFPPKLNKL